MLKCPQCGYPDTSVDVPRLVEALRDILGCQLTGNVDLDAPRFQTARALLAEIDKEAMP